MRTGADALAEVWAEQEQVALEQAAAELGIELDDWFGRYDDRSQAGIQLAAAVATKRGWHALHPLVGAVLDRVARAGRAARGGQAVDIDAADMALLVRWGSQDGFWRHAATAATWVDDRRTLPALRYTRSDLMFAAALARVEGLAALKPGVSMTVTDALFLGGTDPVELAAEAKGPGVETDADAGSALAGASEVTSVFAGTSAGTFAAAADGVDWGASTMVIPANDQATEDLPAGSAFAGIESGHRDDAHAVVSIGAHAQDSAAGMLKDGAALVVRPDTSGLPTHQFGDSPEVVIVSGDLAARAAVALFGPGGSGAEGMRVHNVSGGDAAEKLFGTDLALLGIAGAEVSAVITTAAVDADRTIVAADETALFGIGMAVERGHRARAMDGVTALAVGRPDGEWLVVDGSSASDVVASVAERSIIVAQHNEPVPNPSNGVGVGGGVSPVIVLGAAAGSGVARTLAGSDPTFTHRNTSGSVVLGSVDQGDIATVVAVASAGVGVATRARVTLTPRGLEGVADEANRWATILSNRRAPSDESGGTELRDDAAAVGIDIDLWVVARTGTDPEQALGEIMPLIGDRRGWQPLPGDVAIASAGLLEGAINALAGMGEVPAEHLAAVSGWASRPGFWSKLANAAIAVDDGLRFPFPPASIEVLSAAVETSGDPAAMEDRLGPMRVEALKAIARIEGA
jgi:hypothetical protein